MKKRVNVKPEIKTKWPARHRQRTVVIPNPLTPPSGARHDDCMASYLRYLRAAIEHAELEPMEDGEVYAHIPGFKGLWATGPTAEAAKQDLYSALDGWIYVNFFVAKDKLPTFDGVSLFDPPQKIE
jgi:predicted RNase H-like HicB family nuclease